MFYIVGEWNKNYFLYNSDDDSCKLVPMVELKKSGISAQTIVDSTDYYKLCTLYNFDGSKKSRGRKLFSYSLHHEENYDAKCRGVWDLGFGLYLFLIKCSNLCSKRLRDFESKMHDKYGYMTDYVAVIGFDEEQSRQSGLIVLNLSFKYTGSPDIRRICFNSSRIGITGIVIPVRMLLYTLRLVSIHNYIELFDAYNGIFDKRIIINGVQSVKPRVAYDIIWTDDITSKNFVEGYFLC